MQGGTAMPPAQRWGDGDHMDWNGGGFIVMMIMMSVFWLGTLALIAWGISVFAHRGGGHDAALEIARQRYARGEISAEEFERLKQTL
jgi:putative membrane protein